MLELVGETEVGDDHIAVAIKQQILQLQVPMYDLLGVQVRNSRDELGEQLGGVTFAEISMCKDVVEEFAARRVLNNDADVLVGLDNVV